MYINIEKKEIMNKYLNKSFLKKLLYVGRGLDIAEAVTDYINSDYNNQNSKYEKLVNALWKPFTKEISVVFSGKDYGALKLLLGDGFAHTCREVWDRATLYTYSTGYLRRSYRTGKASRIYLDKNIIKLIDFIYLAATDFSLDRYFKDNKSEYQDIYTIADIISIEIDKNNQDVLNKIRGIIYNDNNSAIVTRQIIQGCLMSRNEEAHRMIGELLLAAKLQEGLRQAIVESMDECSREGFIYLLRLILDNNLSRFSSIVRAFGTWTGLAIEVEKPKVINKCLETAYNCLINRDYLNGCVNSMDNLDIYIGIWAIAFDEIEDIDGPINMLLNSEEKYKKLAALQFLSETQFNYFKHEISCRVLGEKDFEILAFAVKNLFGDLSLYGLNDKASLSPFDKLKDYCYGKRLFNQLKDIVDTMPKKEIEFKGCVFPWINIKLTTAEILDKMLLSVGLSCDDDIVDTLLEYKDKMSADARSSFIDKFMKKPKSIKQKTALIEFCGDRSSWVRDKAYSIVNGLNLSGEDYLIIENFLQYKSGDLRKNSIKLLLKQSPEDLMSSVNRLFESGNENKRLGAIDIVSALEGEKKYKGVYEESLNLITSLGAMSQREKILAENVAIEDKNLKTFENGFGLYDKSKNTDINTPEKQQDFKIEALFSLSGSYFKEVLNKFSSLIYENRDFEYQVTNWDGSKEVVTLGGSTYLIPFDREEKGLENYPISEEIRNFVKENSLGASGLIVMDFYLSAMHRLKYESYSSWYSKLLDDVFNLGILKASMKDIEKMPYYGHIKAYLGLLVNETPCEERFKIAGNILKKLYFTIPADKHSSEYLKNDNRYYYSGSKNYTARSHEIVYWLNMIKQAVFDDNSFTEYFNIAYNYYRASKYSVNTTLNLADFGHALELKIIDGNEIYKELMDRTLSPENLGILTNTHRYGRENIENYPRLLEIGKEVVDTIAGIEVARGELNTEVTHLAVHINKCHGIKIFTAILLGLEKDTYVRGYNFVTGDCTKKQMLSHLLKCCYPDEDENGDVLREYLKGKKITDKQLVEAAMYSPQWLDIVSDYLGYEGLKSACWYFHAHVNEFFSEEKSTIVARYSPIAVQDFKDGAFDQEWFMEAYRTIGAKNFKLVYDSAKYIAGGGLHKRSQLFADATLGKLDLEEVKKRIVEKRNKDYLLVFGLIPLKSKEDTLERYEYIHQFMKETKQFGAQRQASETRSANIALLNLARNAGYSDVNRLSWNMETAKLDSIMHYLKAYDIGDTQVKLEINELGQANILCSKDGKTLKDIPSKLKKHEYIVELKAVKKSLKDQYSRARESFEDAMEKGEEFEVSEIINLSSNPVLAPIVNNLIYKFGDRLGYLNKMDLVDFNGEIFNLSTDEKVIIVHPVHLYESGNWSNYQRDLFDNKLIQPFKQVFRELYLPNEDELQEKTISRRYAGHQIQPKKAAALLKTRGWSASYEEGLQKVYYRENIIATIYALADWFSPAEIEAPTIEEVRFYDRKNFKPIPIKEVPKLIFSEVMRDVDLVVSVAHAGEVDPEASLSTIEIRSVIAKELLMLLGLDNVRIKGSHAYVDGVHGEYTVHLGSGVVHKMGRGAISILPVHSSHRGRIFLPFIDEDPKSIEIISKIILLSEDKKIKDPSILTQICG